MPSSPKFFHARQPHSGRRPTVLLVSFFLLVGIVGFIFVFSSLLRPFHAYKCQHGKPTSVRVVWERSGGAGDANGVVSSSESEHKRHKVMGFVGIQTGFGSVGRRRSLRKTWMPSDPQGLQRYRFVFIFSCLFFMHLF